MNEEEKQAINDQLAKEIERQSARRIQRANANAKNSSTIWHELMKERMRQAPNLH